MRKDYGGLAAYDLDAARTVWSIAWIGRMERQPDLPWVQMAVLLLWDTWLTGTQMNKVQTPWK